MKFSNTTKYPDWFLRRMVSWCAKQLGLPTKCIRKATFGNWRDFRGRAFGNGQILVRVATRSVVYPLDWSHRGVELICPDAEAAIVYVTAHELQHLLNWHERKHAALVADRDMEPHCVRRGKKVMLAFLEAREALMSQWNETPQRVLQAADKPPDPQAETAKKIAKIELRIKQLGTKKKRIETAIRKQTKRLRYYQRAAIRRARGEGE